MAVIKTISSKGSSMSIQRRRIHARSANIHCETPQRNCGGGPKKKKKKLKTSAKPKAIQSMEANPTH
jgi:hypothetical protein